MLHVEAVCPKCGATTELPESFNGRRVRCPACRKRFVVGRESNGEGMSVDRVIWLLSYWTQIVGVLGGLTLIGWGQWLGSQPIVLDRIRNRTMPAAHLGFALGVLLAVFLFFLGRRVRQGDEEGEQVGWLTALGLIFYHVGLIAIATLRNPIAACFAAPIVALPLGMIVMAGPATTYLEAISSGQHANLIPTPQWLIQLFGIFFLVAMLIFASFGK